jgi:hypothetical protein
MSCLAYQLETLDGAAADVRGLNAACQFERGDLVVSGYRYLPEATRGRRDESQQSAFGTEHGIKMRRRSG